MLDELVLLTAAAEDRTGTGRRRLAEAARAGRLIRVRDGVYADAAAYTALRPEARHLVAMRAFAIGRSTSPVFARRSAAVALGLPLLTLPIAVEVTTDRDDFRHLKGVRRFSGPLDPERDVLLKDRLLVTNVERTAVDLARTVTFEEAIVVLDAAVARIGRARIESTADVVRSGAGWARFAKAFAFADGRSESPGESVSRVTMHTLRLPAPVLQHEFRDANGFVARGDFWFPRQRVLGEMDGRAKYFDVSMSKGDPAAVVYREKQRDDRIRALGVRVVRWDCALELKAEALSRLRRDASAAAVSAAVAKHGLGGEARRVHTPRGVHTRPIRECGGVR